MGVEKEEEKTGSEGGVEEGGNDRENTATLKRPWPGEKVISEPAYGAEVGAEMGRGSRRTGVALVTLSLQCTT